MAGAMSDEMPGFNILGLLLGGRGYAANYFAQKDNLAIRRAEEGRRGAFAQGLLASPELANANANPYDRNAQFGLWAQMYGNPGGSPELGNALLDKSLSAIYGREDQTFKDELWKKQLNLSAESELRVDQIKRDRDAQAKKDVLGMLFAPGESGQPGIVQQAQRNMAAKAAGLNVPDGMDVIPNAQGGLSYRPAPGSENWRKMFGEVQANQNIIAGLTNLQDMLVNGTGSKGDWDAEKAALTLGVKNAENLGALDQGALDFIESMIPGYNSNWSANPQNWGGAKEKLRVAIARYQSKLMQVQDKWLIPADMVTNRADDVLAPSAPSKPMPSGPARMSMMPDRGETPGAQMGRMLGRVNRKPPKGPRVFDSGRFD